MIIFSGITPTVGSVSLLHFRNENGDKIDIPVENNTAKMISMYLEKIKTEPIKPVERGNQDEQD